MLNYLQPGHIIEYQAVTAVKSGQMIQVGEMFAVPVVDIAVGEVGACAITGVFTLPKDNAPITQGARAYVNSAGKITADATDNTFVGIAFAPAPADATTVSILLNGLPGPSV